MNNPSFLRDKRLALEIGLREFCLNTGLSPSYWSNAERGHEFFSSDVLEKVQKLFSLSEEEVDFLLKWEATKKDITSYLPSFPPRDFPFEEYAESVKKEIDTF